MLEKILFHAKKLIPKKLFRALQPTYHKLLALAAAVLYGFPSKKIHVVVVTGTKGKSTTVEMINSILEADGQKTAVSGTIRIKIGEKSRRNPYKMTIKGRFFLQRFLRQALHAGCDTAIIEMTSQAVLQYRHKHLSLDAFVFTNLSPEHIESHGSYENYRDAKLEIGKLLEKSRKRPTILVVNADDPEAHHFLKIKSDIIKKFSLGDAKPFDLGDRSSAFTWRGEKVALKTPGKFNIYNALAAATYAEALGVGKEIIKKGLENFRGADGRVEFIKEGQDFDVVVDYAHTIDSLEKFYKIFEDRDNICVLGNTGGGRDKWKRADMARVAERNCVRLIFTNEDPYDEGPEAIVREMYEAVEDKDKAQIIMERREAIAEALRVAKRLSENQDKKPAVLITGKGTDPYIMVAGGKKIPWDDATVVREEIRRQHGAHSS